jgi:hypothetical protein
VGRHDNLDMLMLASACIKALTAALSKTLAATTKTMHDYFFV